MKRVLLKLSGEALAGEKKGFDEATVTAVAKQIKAIAEEGQLDWYCDRWRKLLERTYQRDDRRNKADQIGMLATVMNCIYVSEIFRSVWD